MTTLKTEIRKKTRGKVKLRNAGQFDTCAAQNWRPTLTHTRTAPSRRRGNPQRNSRSAVHYKHTAGPHSWLPQIMNVVNIEQFYVSLSAVFESFKNYKLEASKVAFFVLKIQNYRSGRYFIAALCCISLLFYFTRPRKGVVFFSCATVF